MMKFLILCLMLAGVVYRDSEASEERSFTNEKAYHRISCRTPYHSLTLRNVYDRVHITPVVLSAGRYCTEVIQSPANTYQTYECTLSLKQNAYFVIKSSNREYFTYLCRSFISCYKPVTMTIPSNRVSTYFRAGSGSAGTFFCNAQAVPGF